MKIQVSQFAAWCGVKRSIKGHVTGVKIDSRNIKKGDVFFAFKGQRVNGEDYAQAALHKGASLVVVSKTYEGDDKRILKVSNVEYALQSAAKNYRATLSVKIVGITGSVGKSSTKEMIKQVLTTQYKTIATRGNLNNELGLPLMIFEIDGQHEWAVLEMGMNHFNEIHRLADIAKPTIAVITNIGTAHIEYFGSKNNIAKAKFEIVDYMTTDDHLVLNGNDVMLRHFGEYPCHTHVVGAIYDDISYHNVMIAHNQTTYDAHVDQKVFSARLPLIGEHHVQNAMLALKVGQIAGVSTADGLKALEKTEQMTMRFEIEKMDEVTFINDAYNASKSSISASCKTFMAMPYKKRIVVLGDVLETGDYTKELHTSIGAELSKMSIDLAFFVGDAMAYAYQSYTGEKIHFNSVDNVAKEILKNISSTEDAVLIKASRGMYLERIIENFRSLVND